MSMTDEKLHQDAKTVACLLKRLSNPLRLLIVCHLADGELFARELNELIGTTKGNVSQHLTALLEAKIITRERRGSRQYYKIADSRIQTLMQYLRAAYCGPESGAIVKSIKRRKSNNGKSRRIETA